MSADTAVERVTHLLLKRIGRSGHLPEVLNGMTPEDRDAALEIYDGVEADRRRTEKGWGQ